MISITSLSFSEDFGALSNLYHWLLIIIIASLFLVWPVLSAVLLSRYTGVCSLPILPQMRGQPALRRQVFSSGGWTEYFTSTLREKKCGCQRQAIWTLYHLSWVVLEDALLANKEGGSLTWNLGQENRSQAIVIWDIYSFMKLGPTQVQLLVSFTFCKDLE